MLPDLTKTVTFTISFFLTEKIEGFQTLHDYKLAWGLPVHARFDDLDFVSRPLVAINWMCVCVCVCECVCVCVCVCVLCENKYDQNRLLQCTRTDFRNIQLHPANKTMPYIVPTLFIHSLTVSKTRSYYSSFPRIICVDVSALSSLISSTRNSKQFSDLINSYMCCQWYHGNSV